MNSIIFRPLILILVSSSYTLFSLLPYKSWIRITDFIGEPFPNIDIYSDSAYYLGQIREIINGNYFIGNPILFEYARDGFSYGNSSLFYLWGSLGNLLNLNLINLYLLMISINSFILIVALTKLLNIFIEFKLSIILSLILSILAIGPLGRPSPTEQMLPLFLIVCTLVLNNDSYRKQNIKKIFFILIVSILVTGNPYFTLLLFLLVLIDIIFFRQNNRFYFYTVSIISSAYFTFTRFIFDSQDELVAQRLGLIYSRIPGALSITIPSVSIIIFLVSLYRRKSFLAKELSADNLIKIKKCVALHFALLAAVNSQVLTGFALEMESHYRYVYYIFLTVAILIIFEITRKRFRFNLLKIESSNLIYILFFIVYLVYLSLQFESVRPQQTFKSQIIKQVNENKNIKSLLIRDSSDLYVLRSQFIYLTNVYLYWGPGAEFSKISNGEILKRKTCSQSSLLSYNQFLRSDLSALPRNLINETKRVERLNKFLKYIGFRVNTTPINFLFENEYKLYLEYAQECSAADFEFRADLVLD